MMFVKKLGRREKLLGEEKIHDLELYEQVVAEYF